MKGEGVCVRCKNDLRTKDTRRFFERIIGDGNQKKIKQN